MKYQYVNTSIREKVIKDKKGKQHTLKPLGGMVTLDEEVGDNYGFLRRISETNLSISKKTKESDDVFKEPEVNVDKGDEIIPLEVDEDGMRISPKKSRSKKKKKNGN